MARRSITGQLNMFEMLRSLEPAEGEVEMVSLMPEPEVEPEPEAEIELEPEIVPEPEIVTEAEIEPEVEDGRMREYMADTRVSMCRSYVVDGMQIEIAYINYNKVRLTRGNEKPQIYEFSSTKEAVDYYVEQMQEYEEYE